MPIELQNVSYTYAPATPFEAQALRKISLTIAEGEIIGITGRTGCGKTTLLQLMAGLLHPTGGKILLDGADIQQKNYDMSRLRQRLGIVFQYPEIQLFETTVERDVAFGLKYSGLSSGEKEERVRWALTTVGLSDERLWEQSPLALSGGQKRLLAIAGVLAARPGILLFDEPIAGLDPQGRESFLALADRLHQSGVTILMVSHDADSIVEHVSRVLVLGQGELLMDGTPAEVFAAAAKAEDIPIGLSAPARVAEGLRQRGFAVPQETVRYGELLAAVRHRLKGGEKP